MTARTITVQSRYALEQQADRLVDRGYRYKRDTGDTAVLRETGLGSIWWHLLFLLTTAGFGNVLYALRCWIGADTVRIIVVEGGD